MWLGLYDKLRSREFSKIPPEYLEEYEAWLAEVDAAGAMMCEEKRQELLDRAPVTYCREWQGLFAQQVEHPLSGIL
jgi:hypothetical protein|tara:strand:+ start:1303 stop:1530 length:228 start_codon:yes stop_codon:yes gene_type:complete